MKSDCLVYTQTKIFVFTASRSGKIVQSSLGMTQVNSRSDTGEVSIDWNKLVRAYGGCLGANRR